MKKRNIFIAFMLSFFTLGIYNIIFMCSLQNDINQEDSEVISTKRLAFTSIFTLGLGFQIWARNIGFIFNSELNKKNFHTLFVLSTLFSPLTVALIQNVINENLEELGEDNNISVRHNIEETKEEEIQYVEPEPLFIRPKKEIISETEVEEIVIQEQDDIKPQEETLEFETKVDLEDDFF